MSRSNNIKSSSTQVVPVLSCYWRIYFEGFKISANEVTGLDEKISLIPYRAGNFLNGFQQIQVQERQNQILKVKWGIFPGGQNGADLIQLWRDTRSYYNKYNTIDILVTLQDDNDNEVMYWVCRHCIPTEFLGPTLQGQKSEIAMQTISLSVGSIQSYYVDVYPDILDSFFEKFKHNKH